MTFSVHETDRVQLQVRHVELSIGNKEMSFRSSSHPLHATGKQPSDSNEKWIRRWRRKRSSFVEPDNTDLLRSSTCCALSSRFRAHAVLRMMKSDRKGFGIIWCCAIVVLIWCLSFIGKNVLIKEHVKKITTLIWYRCWFQFGSVSLMLKALIWIHYSWNEVQWPEKQWIQSLFK